MIVLSGVLLVGTQNATAEQEGDYTYIVSEGKATITGYTGNGGDLVIPSTFGGFTTYAIGDNAFYSSNRGLILSIVVPDEIEIIGAAAFYDCPSLISITIGKGVTTIGEHAFSFCPSLISIIVDESNIDFSSLNGVLYNKMKTELILCPSGKVGPLSISTGVINIDEYALRDCSHITSVTMPESVITIGQGAFYRCSSLISIEIPSTVKEIGMDAFFECFSLTSINVNEFNTEYASIDGVLYNKVLTTLIHCPSGKEGELNIPEGMTVISISGCPLITSIIIPKSVMSIESLFFGCPSLSSINVDLENKNYASYDGVLYSKDFSIVIRCPEGKEGMVSLPNNVTIIGDHSFYSCAFVTNITIPDGITIIGYSAFYSCTSLTSINIPDGLTTVGDGAFARCSTLTSIAFPNGVSKIGSYVFMDCTALTSVNIPNNVTYIGNYQFSGCRSLKSISIPSQVYLIGECAFFYCSQLTSIYIPKNVTTIYERAFTFCSSLTSIDVDPFNSKYSSNNGVLYNKTATKLIQCPSGKMGDFVIPNSVNEIEIYAFAGCQYLTSVTISENVIKIGYGAFEWCTSLTSMVIPGNVNIIGGGAFSDCIALSRAEFEGNAPICDNSVNSASIFINCNPNLVVFHYLGAIGYTHPMWQGVNCVEQKITELIVESDTSLGTLGAITTISGVICTYKDHQPISGLELSIAYSVNNGLTWVDLPPVTSSSDGSFNLSWIPQATGMYLVRTVWNGNIEYCNISRAFIMAISWPPESNLFVVQSNSTLSNLVFNSETKELSFTVSGESGTFGYAQIAISKQLVTDGSKIKLTMDGTNVSYELSSTINSWLLYVAYSHSSHLFVANLNETTPALPLTLSVLPDNKTGTAPFSINFSSTITGGMSPYSYYWDFGDGNTSNSANPSHTYETPGEYTVTLTVIDGGSNTITNTTNVTIHPIESSNPSDSTLLVLAGIGVIAFVLVGMVVIRKRKVEK